MSDVFDFLGVDENEAEEVLKEIQGRRAVLDRRVCICGHPMARHEFDVALAQEVCSPNAAGCMCDSPRAVLETSDLRKFLRSTKGMGSSHALTQGMIAAKKAGVEMNWIEQPSCNKCGASGVRVLPAPVSSRGEILDKSSKINVFLCIDCVL